MLHFLLLAIINFVFTTAIITWKEVNEIVCYACI